MRNVGKKYKNNSLSSSKYTHGFTIVELLIVIVIIAILAAITIVAYNGIQTRANTSADAAALNQVNQKIAAYMVESTTPPTDLASVGVNNGNTNFQYSYDSTANSYCVTATTGSVSYYISTTTGIPTTGSCPGHGTGGVPAITNLIRNPTLASVTTDWSGATSSATFTTTKISGLSPPLPSITTAFRMTTTAAPTTWWRLTNTANPVLTENVSYSFSGYVRPSVTCPTGTVIQWYNSSGSLISESGGAFTGQNGGTWARRSVTAISPATTTTAKLQIGCSSNGTTSATLDGTAFFFEASTSVDNYADPNTNANWVWTIPSSPSLSQSIGPAV